MGSVTIKPTLTPLSLTSINTRISYSFFNFTNFHNFKPSFVTFCYNSPSNSINPRPDDRNRNRNRRSNPLRVLVPLLQSVKSFAYSQKRKWISRFQAYSADIESVVDLRSDNCLQNGAFGVALLSVTSTAKVKISPFVATLAANPTFVSGLLAWFVAQSMKVFLNFFVERKWDLRLLCACGGMPSSHSAICMALTTSVAICHGVADSLFPVCLGFSLIVMYDAIGVRRHAGMQAEVLNMIIADLFQGHPISQRKLKELLGHTPSQVFAGAMVGILVACICCQNCLVAI